MKYTIEGFNQHELVNNGLDARDAVFMRWFVDFQATGKMSYKDDEEGNRHYWINHKTLAEELPVLGFSSEDTRSLRRYLKRLRDKDVLYSVEQRRGKNRGTAIYYRINPELMITLMSRPNMENDQRTQMSYTHRTQMSSATQDPNVLWDSSSTDSSYKDESSTAGGLFGDAQERAGKKGITLHETTTLKKALTHLPDLLEEGETIEDVIDYAIFETQDASPDDENAYLATVLAKPKMMLEGFREERAEREAEERAQRAAAESMRQREGELRREREEREKQENDPNFDPDELFGNMKSFKKPLQFPTSTIPKDEISEGEEAEAVPLF